MSVVPASRLSDMSLVLTSKKREGVDFEVDENGRKRKRTDQNSPSRISPDPSESSVSTPESYLESVQAEIPRLHEEDDGLTAYQSRQDTNLFGKTSVVKQDFSKDNGEMLLDEERQSEDVLSPLCKTCADIDFKGALSRTPKKGTGTFVCRLAPVQTNTTCRLCRFFASMFPPTEETEPCSSTLGYHLRALKLSEYLEIPRHLKDLRNVVALAIGSGDCLTTGPVAAEKFLRGVQETGLICPIVTDTRDPPDIRYSDMLHGRQVLPLQIDFDAVRRWIRLCRRNHSSCARSNARVPGLKMIDCATRSIVPAPARCRYVALSYVWGSQAALEQQRVETFIPSSAPRVIEDAITVALELGYEYLWIDRYCIDPTQDKERHTQIKSMDIIYSGAALTIIAAAGEDPTFGLPGVSCTPRLAQPCVKVGNYTLASGLRNPRLEILASKWNSRGWTYQEGLLSRRRLIFTASQVYFQCTAMHCLESMCMPLGLLHTASGAFHKNITKCRVFPPGTGSERPIEYLKRIEEYSSRQLSRESDVLSAIYGVLKLFDREQKLVPYSWMGMTKLQAPPRLYQFWGLPIMTLADNSSQYPPVQCKQLGQSLVWVTDKPSKRRCGFPSWSWVGWSNFAGLQMLHIGTDLEKLGSYIYDIKIYFQLKDQSCIRWDYDYEGMPKQYRYPDAVSQYLHIFGWSFMVRLKKTRDGSEWRLPDLDFSNYKLFVSMELDDSPDDLLLDAVLLGYCNRRGLGVDAKVLILGKEIGSQYRFGLLEFRFRSKIIMTESTAHLEATKNHPGIKFERRWFKVG